MDRRTVVNLFGAVVGVGLLVALVFVLGSWLGAMRMAREDIPVSQQSKLVSASREGEEQVPPESASPEQADPTAEDGGPWLR